MIDHTCSYNWQNGNPKRNIKRNSREHFSYRWQNNNPRWNNKRNSQEHRFYRAVLKKNPKVHRRKENPTTKNSRSQHECFRIRKVWRVKSAVVKTNSVFYSVFVVMWRCSPINLHSSTIPAHLPKPKYKLSFIISTKYYYAGCTPS